MLLNCTDATQSEDAAVATVVDHGHEDTIDFFMGLKPHSDVDFKGMTGNTA